MVYLTSLKLYPMGVKCVKSTLQAVALANYYTESMSLRPETRQGSSARRSQADASNDLDSSRSKNSLQSVDEPEPPLHTDVPKTRSSRKPSFLNRAALPSADVKFW